MSDKLVWIPIKQQDGSFEWRPTLKANWVGKTGYVPVMYDEPIRHLGYPVRDDVAAKLLVGA